VAENRTNSENPPEIKLKDPALAAFLAWLVPGLGHWYQGRRAKAILFFVCIMGVFGWGVYVGGDSITIPNSNIKIGYGRAVYFAWNREEWRLPFFCQIGVGLPTLPAVIQALRVSEGNASWGGFMAPPRMEPSTQNEARAALESDQPTLNQLHFYLHYYFELATTYTMIGGLLNILAIYDAYAGPVFVVPAKKEDEDEKKEEKEEKK
jgi:hypothetical protein